MSLELQLAEEEDLEIILKLQREAFKGLLTQYEDYDMSPDSQGISNILRRFKQASTEYLLIKYVDQNIGAVRIIKNENEGAIDISPMFISSSFQGLGLAQKVFDLIEDRFSWAKTLKLETILQEEKLCCLYEEMGFEKTGLVNEIKDGMSFVYYEKHRP